MDKPIRVIIQGIDPKNKEVYQVEYECVAFAGVAILDVNEETGQAELDSTDIGVVNPMLVAYMLRGAEKLQKELSLTGIKMTMLDPDIPPILRELGIDLLKSKGEWSEEDEKTLTVKEEPAE